MSAVDDVKAKLDIVEVVEGYVRLQKAGRYFKANCPFHNEKTPSFYVYPDRQSWHCFGACATGGDVISFISRQENLDFTGALRLLAERAGVELRNDGPRRQEVKTLQDANEAACVYFHSLLQTSERALTYVEERGLNARTLSDFQIGYAPPGWENLRDHLISRGFSEAHLVQAGLLVEGERRPYDRFRDRLIIPIRDDRGRVAGFGGRELPGGTDGQGRGGEASQAGAKYVNTPQSPVFDKSSLLYALDRAKDEIRRQGVAVIVEGYMDAIAAHQFGYRNVVASMGTALTEKQAALLQRFAERVVLAMDADEAGKAANLRAIQVVAASQRQSRVQGRPRSLDIRVLALPRGKDPDELIRSDPAAWEAAVEAALPIMDHIYAIAKEGKDPRNAAHRREIADEMLPHIAQLTNVVERAEWLQRIAGGDRALLDALWRQMSRPRSGRSSSGEPAVSAAPRPSGAGQREAFCLALLYASPGLRNLGQDLDQNLFQLSENRELYLRWRDDLPITEEEGWLWEHYQSVLATRIPFTETSQMEQAFLDCVDRLERVTIKAVKEASALALAEAEAGVRPGQVASFARAQLGAGKAEETSDDADTIAVASQLLEDMEAGLRFHRRLIEGPRSDQQGSHSGNQAE